MKAPTGTQLQQILDDLTERAKAHSDLEAVLTEYYPQLIRCREALLNKEARQNHTAKISLLCEEADQLVKTAIKHRHERQPSVRAKLELEQAIRKLRHLVMEADRQFEEALRKKTLKWWVSVTRDRTTLVEIENQIEALEVALEKISASSGLISAEQDYEHLKQLVDQRLAIAKARASDAIPESHRRSFEPDHALSLGLISASLSVPVSVAMDLDQAGSVYDALRKVNSNYAELTDFEIWQETLTMSADSLVGLASLTKGSYFESLVEEDFGGELFANFNHPDTDIIIDGVAYQIKATDSVSYINSVADDIPVIATTEVADDTGAIDGGYTDLELSNAVDLALGGTLVDFGDTVLDGMTAGFGGVGIVAIVQGANSGWKHYKTSGDAVEALGEGISTTATGVVRSAVNLAEIVFRGGRAIVTSPPVHFLVRNIAKKGSSSRKDEDVEPVQNQSSPSNAQYRTAIDFPSDNTIILKP